MMNEQNAVDLLKRIEGISVGVWIDGGWGVDALVGYQTRPHNDIDIFIEMKDNPAFIEMLTSEGYKEISKDFTTDSHTAWQDSSGLEIDLHLFEFLDRDTLCFEKNIYPADILAGTGTIGGLAVRCLTAEAQLLYHQGYKHSAKDTQDVLVLCKTFGLEIPAEYKT
jgi:lincosamide nucleotidyltransferase A/C/D/E